MSTTYASEYQKQAAEFLTKAGLTFKAAQHPHQSAPSWSTEAGLQFYAYDKASDTRVAITHGFRYVVTIARTNGQALEFDFWGSIADRQKAIESRSKLAGKVNAPALDAYDVLAGLDASPLEADEVYAEFGGMKPSRAEEIAAFNRKVRAFFTDAELEALAEIQ